MAGERYGETDVAIPEVTGIGEYEPAGGVAGEDASGRLGSTKPPRGELRYDSAL